MTYSVHIQQRGLMALFDLKGTESALLDWCTLPPFPSAPLTYTTQADQELMAIGPEHWILRAPLDQEEPLLMVLRPESAPADLSIVHISDTLCFFEVTGPDVSEVMAVATPLDTHADIFPTKGATFSEIFSVKALIIRVDGGFHLGVDRSYVPMIADYLARTIAD